MGHIRHATVTLSVNSRLIGPSSGCKGRSNMHRKFSRAHFNAILFVSLTALLSVSADNASGDVFSEAAKIGANAGAMRYCRDKVASEADQSKYKLLVLKTAEKFDELDSSDKVKALAYRKAGEDGDYLGDRLTEARCDSLRKTLFIKYK